MFGFVKFLYYLSCTLFVLVLFWDYYQLPDQVAISLDENIGLRTYISKSTLFYAGMAIFFPINFLWSVLFRMAPHLPYTRFARPNRSFWLSSKDSVDSLVQVFQVWIRSYVTLFNVFVAVLFFILYLINVHEIGTFWNYRFLVWGGIALLGLWWLVLPLRLMLKQHQL